MRLENCAWPSRLRNQPNSQQLAGKEAKHTGATSEKKSASATSQTMKAIRSGHTHGKIALRVSNGDKTFERKQS
jgi:hypothetical protein